MDRLIAQTGEKRGTIDFGVPVTTPYRYYELQDPDRIVIDLEDTTFIHGPDRIDVAEGPIKSIRTAQFTPDVTRVVFDLHEPADLRFRPYGTTLAIEYGQLDRHQLA